MLKIKRIEIHGIWGQRNIETNFNSDVNIFIGINGTGKTTFLNIIEAILTIDLALLAQVDFTSVTLLLHGKKNKKITVNRFLGEYPYNMFEYKISNKKYDVPQLPEDAKYNMHRINPRFRAQISELREELNNIVKICWLSVHRDVQTPEESDFSIRRERNPVNTVDLRLKDLMKRLAIYQLQLEAESSALSSQFRNEMYELMLYNEGFDELDLKQPITIDAESIKRQLIKAYRDLGLSKKDTIDRINIHTQKLKDALERVEKAKTEKGQLTVNDIPPISLLNRTLKLIEISTEIEKKRNKIFGPLNTYISILKEFIKDKSFKLDTHESGELLVFNRKEQSDSFPISYLSSGEKQLIILLTEALLQKNSNYIFIADEPELSLHISWQRKIIEAIRQLNQNAQIILATHSPEIAGKWSDKIINMENIIKIIDNA